MLKPLSDDRAIRLVAVRFREVSAVPSHENGSLHSAWVVTGEYGFGPRSEHHFAAKGNRRAVATATDQPCAHSQQPDGSDRLERAGSRGRGREAEIL